MDDYTIYSPDLGPLARNLRQIDNTLPRELGRIHKKIGKLVVEETKKKIPVSARDKRGGESAGGGALRKTVKASGTQSKATVFLNKGEKLAYGAVQEYGYQVGWVSSGNKPRTRGGRLMPLKVRSFLNPAKVVRLHTGDFRSMKHALIRANDWDAEGRYLGHTVRTHLGEVADTYAEEIDALFQKTL